MVERTFESIGSLFSQYVAGFKGSNVTRRGLRVDDSAIWTLPELQQLFDEWVITGWQARRHDSLRDPLQSSRMLSPNEMYAAMVAAAGYVPVGLTGDDYIELLPMARRMTMAFISTIGRTTARAWTRTGDSRRVL